jgi:hypothetical protein
MWLMASPQHLDDRVESFLAGFEERLAAMAPDEFLGHKAALVASKLNRDRNLGDASDRHWGHISTGRMDFWAREEEVAELEGLELHHVQVGWLAGSMLHAKSEMRPVACDNMVMMARWSGDVLHAINVCTLLLVGVVPGAHLRQEELVVAQAVSPRVPGHGGLRSSNNAL